MKLWRQSLVALSFLALTEASAATAQQPETKGARPSTNIVTLTGCIIANPNQPGGFLLSDTDQVSRYRLTGTNVRDYAGKRVQVSGSRPKRMQIVGGLYPSPNIAAQGGSDPTKAAMAAASGPNAAGSRPLSEFRVRSVRAISGACPE